MQYICIILSRKKYKDNSVHKIILSGEITQIYDIKIILREESAQFYANEF